MNTSREPDDTTSSSSLLPELERMADQIRVRIHLAGLDAKDAWAKLEHRLHELEEKTRQRTGAAKEQLGELAGKLEHELKDLFGRLPKDDGSSTPR